MRFFLLLGVLLVSACESARVDVNGDDILIFVHRQNNETLELSTGSRWVYLSPVELAEAYETAALRYASDWCPSAVMTHKVPKPEHGWAFRFSCPARAAAAAPEG